MWATGRGGRTLKTGDALTQAAILPDWMVARTQKAAGEIELTDDEAASFALFAALGTQWHRCPMTGTRLGLQYLAIEPTARLHDISLSPARMRDLQAMELEVIALSAEEGRRRR